MEAKKPTNRGAVALGEALAERGARRKLARKLGIGQEMITRWISGEHAPLPKYRALLEEDPGIPWRLWDEPVRTEDSNGDAAA